jgi:phospholipase C
MATKSKKAAAAGKSKKAGSASKNLATASKKKSAAKPKTQKASKVSAIKKPMAMAAAPVKFVAMAADAAQDNLSNIEHIVVLMLENRSFDHILGYLTLENGRSDVDGLTKQMHNTFKNVDYFAKLRTQTAFLKTQDPCHGSKCVTEQLSGNNGGFVSNYARNYPKDPEVDLVMNYYNGATLKVYEQLIKDSCICDRWFCSVDGATWPNRLYSVTGQSGGTKDNKKIPLYDLPSFVRHLSAGKVSWRWYAHRSPATLRLIDSQYRNILHLKAKNFSFFDRRSDFGGNSFLEDAAQGKLASVSWIDPDFGNPLTQSHKNENDDHPPVDIMAGQQLVLKLYNAIISSPQWNKTLLVVVYDEHGGLYDHVSPPAAEDNRPTFQRYGVRVPAFIVSPFIEPNTVSHVVFDHTSLIKTILLKFCKRADGSIPDMGKRVTNANHLGVLLTRPTPRSAPSSADLIALAAHLAASQGDALESSLSMQAQGDTEPTKANDVQLGVKRARQILRAEGLSEDQP